MEKENFAEQVSNDLGFSRLVQHIKNKEPMLFVFLHKAEYTPEVNHTRQMELKGLAIGIGKKYAMDYVLFTDAEGRTMEISTQKDSLGAELEVPSSITIEDLQRYFSYVGQRKFVIKVISEPEQSLYGTWMNAMLCNSWQAYAKKYGVDALEIWDSQVK